MGSLGLAITLGCRLKCGTRLCKTGNFVLQAEILGYKYKSRLVGKKPAFGLQIQKAYTWAANTKKPAHLCRLNSLVASTGFEPAISALRGRRPKPLDDEAIDA